MDYLFIFIFLGCPSIDPLATAGVIYSPNFPWNYGNGMSCSWTITSPSQERIHLNFTQFSLESSISCHADYVEARYSYYYNRKFCGYTIPSSIFTYSGSITVTFSSDVSITRSGFIIFYQIRYRFSSPAPATTTIYPYTYPHFTVWRTTANPASLYGACTPGSQNSKLCVNPLLSLTYLLSCPLLIRPTLLVTIFIKPLLPSPAPLTPPPSSLTPRPSSLTTETVKYVTTMAFFLQ